MVRNRMLTVELQLAVLECFLGLGAVVTGLFGMNLVSGWEEVRYDASIPESPRCRF